MIEHLYYDIRDRFCNKAIQFLLKHCAIHHYTLYLVGKKCSMKQMQSIFDQIREEKKENG